MRRTFYCRAFRVHIYRTSTQKSVQDLRITRQRVMLLIVSRLVFHYAGRVSNFCRELLSILLISLRYFDHSTKGCWEIEVEILAA